MWRNPRHSEAEGWADAGLGRLTGATGEDPLTGLVSFAYLRTRLREIYREYRQRGASRRGRGPQRTARSTKRAGIERAAQLGCGP